jgi:hypothetical protein
MLRSIFLFTFVPKQQELVFILASHLNKMVLTAFKTTYQMQIIQSESNQIFLFEFICTFLRN